MVRKSTVAWTEQPRSTVSIEIAAVEQALWPFVSVQEPYIAALISVGRTADAMRAASEAERDYLAAVAARGAAVRESDLAFVRRVQGLSH
jgi:prephenate dehydratase